MKRVALEAKLLQELGGANSSRLVLGGLLADLSAEHYSWVASGDESNPDATKVQERADAFLERLCNRGFLPSLVVRGGGSPSTLRTWRAEAIPTPTSRRW